MNKQIIVKTEKKKKELLTGLRYHHGATCRGYVSVKHDIFIPYAGRFGKGYKVLSHNPQNNYYCNVNYYVAQ